MSGSSCVVGNRVGFGQPSKCDTIVLGSAFGETPELKKARNPHHALRRSLTRRISVHFSYLWVEALLLESMRGPLIHPAVRLSETPM